jgi:hypothetical protein
MKLPVKVRGNVNRPFIAHVGQSLPSSRKFYKCPLYLRIGDMPNHTQGVA